MTGPSQPTASAAPASSSATQTADTAADNLKHLHDGICASFHAIETLRGQRLGLLPLASGAGILLLLGTPAVTTARQFLLPIGLVGALITLGLFAYEVYGIQLGNELKRYGRVIEEALVPNTLDANQIRGPLRSIPHSVGRVVNDMTAGSIVYASVLSGWIFVALVDTMGSRPALLIAGLMLLVGIGLTILIQWSLALLRLDST